MQGRHDSMMNMMDRLVKGQGHQLEVDVLLEYAWPIQGLMRHFRPEVERRITEFRQANGPVFWGLTSIRVYIYPLYGVTAMENLWKILYLPNF
jgi:hypothetical protein